MARRSIPTIKVVATKHALREQETEFAEKNMESPSDEGA